MSYSLPTTSAAYYKGGGFGTPADPSAQIVNGGYVNDDSDSSYVDSVAVVYDYFSNGQDRLAGTKGYAWDFVPASSAPSFYETSNHMLQVRARVAVITDDINLTVGDDWWLGFHFTRTSDGLTITDGGSWNVTQPFAPMNTPFWITRKVDLTTGHVDNTGPWEALRTGVYPGYGAIQLGWGWSAQPGNTGAPSPIGSESRFRLYEMHWTLQPGGWSVGEDHIGM